MVPTNLLARMASSDIFRYAAFAFASSILAADNQDNHTSLYLDRCYRRLRQALSGPLSIDLAYAIYLLAIFSIAYADPVPHLVALAKIICALQLDPWTESSFWISIKYTEALQHFSCRLGHQLLSGDRVTEPIRTGYNLVRGLRKRFSEYPGFSKTVYFLHYTHALLLLNGDLDGDDIGTANELSLITTELRQITREIRPDCDFGNFRTDLERLQTNGTPVDGYTYENSIFQLQSYICSEILTQLLENVERESSEIEAPSLDLFRLVNWINILKSRGDPVELEKLEVLLLFILGIVWNRSQFPEGNFPCTTS